MKMKIFQVWFLLIIAATSALGGRGTATLIPLRPKPVTLLIDRKEKEYYMLSVKEPISLQVDGPGRLTVLSRLMLPVGLSETQKYTIRIKDGQKTLHTHSTQTDKSDATFQGADAVPGKSRKFSLDIPDGSSTYRIQLEDTKLPAAVKFTFQPSRGAGKQVAIEPLSYDRVVTLVISENLVAYYVASQERPVQLRIVGPTRVQVSTRLNYDDRMNGAQKYSVIVEESGRRVLERSLQTTKSTGSSYQEWKEVVPGKSNLITLDVPPGEHSYRVTLGETMARTLSLHFSLPQKDLKNTE